MTRQEAIEFQERLFPAKLWRDRMGYERYHKPTLPEIALDLRAALNGSADPWPNEAIAEVCDMLRERLATWNLTSEDGVDRAVYQMVNAAVWQAANYLDAQLKTAKGHQ